MTEPKIRTIRRGDNRFYVHPDKVWGQVPGVTSVVGQLPKPWLKPWASKLVAQTAVDSLVSWLPMYLDGHRDAAVDFLKRAPNRLTGNAADMGTEAHTLFEELARGQVPRRVHPDLGPYRQGFEEFLETYDPTFLHIEETVWSSTHGYAGSFDAIATIEGARLEQDEDACIILDFKTTRSGVHPEVALQLNAYARADFILNPDGSTTDLPDINAAAVLHVRPEGWRLVPVRLGDDVFDLFCSLIPVTQWERDIKETVLADAIGGNYWGEED